MANNIVDKELVTEMKTSYTSYAMSVIVGRALPDIRDGLKPVHRRVLYSMNEQGMVFNQPYKKSARVVGDVMGKYHPHGDCLRGDTLFFLANGTFATIRELYDRGVPEDVISVTHDGKLQIAPAHSFRIGQYTNEIYNIHLSNGAVIRATGNHPVRTAHGDWIAARDLRRYTRLTSSTLRLSDVETYRPAISILGGAMVPVQSLIPVANGSVRHHQDLHVNNNALSNVVQLSRAEHAKCHEDYLVGLKHGRDTMFGGSLTDATREKNSRLMQTFNEWQPLYKAYKILDAICHDDHPVTELAYETYRNKRIVYNSPHITTLIDGGYIDSFSDLVAKHASKFLPVKLANISIRRDGMSDSVRSSNVTNMHRASAVSRIFKVFDHIIDRGVDITVDEYKASRAVLINEFGMGAGRVFARNYPTADNIETAFSQYVDIYKNKLIYVTDVVAETVNNEPMYDFTVDSNANALICVGTCEDSEYYTLVCVHNSAIYDTIVRLAQPFSMRYPLIDGQGNFGSIDGDPAAASRYTEVRLSRIASELLSDIDKETVDFTPNYDDSLQEPGVLPGRLPNLLLNGSEGIAVGMATNIPPHNINDVINSIVALIDNPDADSRTIIQLLRGPDFPTGGIIMGQAGIYQMYETGKGSIVLRGRAAVESSGRRDKIVITELPYHVNKATLTETIAELSKSDTIEGIADIRDESDKDGIRLVIEVKNGYDAGVMLNQLYAHTDLQTSFSANLVSLIDGIPKTVTVRTLLQEHIDHREKVVIRRTKYDLDKAERRLHILYGLLIALKHIDDVVRIVRGAESPFAAKMKLTESYELDEVQAGAILDMKLSRLTNLESGKIQSEASDLEITITKLKAILVDRVAVFRIIKDELEELRSEYGDPRRTTIDVADVVKESANGELLIQPEDVVVTMTADGFIKRQPVTVYRSQNRGGKGSSGSGLRAEDCVTGVFKASTLDHLLIISDAGKAYKLKVYEIPEASKTARGRAVTSLLGIPDETIVGVLPVNDFANGYVIFAMRSGNVARIALEAFSHRSGILAVNLEDDALVDVMISSGNDEILLATRRGKTIRFSETEIRASGRGVRGVRGININATDAIIGMTTCDDSSYLLTITANGMGKRTPFSEYPAHKRARGGVKGIILIKTQLCSVLSVRDDDDMLITTKSGVMIRVPVCQVKSQGRTTQGVKIMNVKLGDEVSAATKLS